MSAGVLTKFDILFLDIDLGNKNGIELARIMREHNAEAVLILVTISVSMPRKVMR